MASKLPGLFCLEGEWDGGIDDPQSVLPVLELLERQEVLRFVHRNVHTVAEFEYHLTRWVAEVAHFNVLYLAFHGSRDGLALTEDGDSVSLQRLGSLIGKAGKGAVIHLGSCSVMERPESELKSFVRATGARAICGYEKDVDWIDSAAIDLAFSTTWPPTREPAMR